MSHQFSRNIRKFDAGNTNLFQTKIFSGKINGTKMAMHLIKITIALVLRD